MVKVRTKRISHRGRWTDEAHYVARWLRLQGASEQEIAKSLNVHVHTVQRWEHRPPPSTPRAARTATPQVLQRRKLVDKLRKATKSVEGKRFTPKLRKERVRTQVVLAFPTCAAIAAELSRKHKISASAETVRRDLRSVACVARRQRKTPMLTDAQRQKRVQFCRWALVNRPLCAFTDEAWIDGNHGAGWYWTRDGDVRVHQRLEKHGAKVMIWGLICPGVRACVALPAESITAAKYENDVLASVLPTLRKANALGYVIQEDNARVHRAALWFKRKKVKVLSVPWPPNSCDLSLVENHIAIVKRNVRRRFPFGVEELAQYAKEEWMKVPEETVQRMYDGWHDRLRDCIAAKGDIVKPRRHPKG